VQDPDLACVEATEPPDCVYPFVWNRAWHLAPPFTTAARIRQLDAFVNYLGRCSFSEKSAVEPL
jgi:hypothetical protein